MGLVKAAFICMALICCNRVVLNASQAGNETTVIIKRLDTSLDREMKPSNDTSSETSGPPDSHEAMNNREIHPKVREKRSYEFLMGLINNNSRYEVTRVDPELTTQKPEMIPGVNASELLLELMVRIASHPEQWDRVHNLLQTIDEDLKTSKNVVKKLRALSNDTNFKTIENQPLSVEKSVYMVTSRSKQENVTITTPNISEKKWPDFDKEESSLRVENNINYTGINENRIQSVSPQKSKHKSNKSAYPKNFTYHRVTGKPDNMNKHTRAYIAVSVIAPKPTHTGTSEEDVELENELHQLKPWSHIQNLKNMKTLRSKWVMQQHNEGNENS